MGRFLRKNGKSLLLGAVIFFVSLVSFPSFVAAQPDPRDELTPENGWTCTATYSRCTHTDGSTAFCQTSTGATGQRTETSCTINRIDGTQESGTAAAGASDLAGAAVGVVADTANTLVLKPLVMFILTFAGWVLGIAGVFFNWVVIKTVFQFGAYFGTTDSMLTAWGVVRDIANIGLLFGFILMGVLLILNVDGGGHGHGHGGGISARRAIPRLIIFAVLLNFSLFATQAVIDVSNAFSASLATLAGEECTGQESTADCANEGIAGRVVQLAGIGTVWDEGIIEAFSTSTVTLLGLSVFVIITAIVLLAAGIMLIGRVVILTLLMVTSPIGFAGLVIPGLGGAASRWWSTLISQAFFAPVLLLFIFLSLKLAESLNPGKRPLVEAFAGANSSLSGNLEVLVVFAVVIGLMIASLVAASRLGAMGGSFATNSASALAFGSLTRGTNFAVGGGARALRGAVQRSSFGNTAAGRALVNRGLRPLETTNLDMRRAPGMASALGAAGITAGAKPAEHATYGEMAHQLSDIRDGKGSQKLTQQYEQERNLDALDRSHGNLSDDQKEFLKKLGAKDLAKLHSLSAIAGEMSDSQFNALMKEKDLIDDAQKGSLKAARVTTMKLKAASMTPDQFETALKNEHFNGADKDSIKEARFAELTAAIAGNNTDAINELTKAISKKEMVYVPGSIVAQSSFRDALTDKQRDDFIESDSRTKEEKALVGSSYTYAKINNEFKAGGGVEAAAAQMRNLTPAQIAKLDAGILTSPQAAVALKPAALAELVNAKKLTTEQMSMIGKNIRGNDAAMSDPAMKNFMEGQGGAMW